MICDGERTVRIFLSEGLERVDSRKWQRRVVRMCGNDEGEEECRDHSARQRWVEGWRWGVREVRREGRMEGWEK